METTQVVHKWTTLMQVWHPAQTEANLADNLYKKLQNLRLRTYQYLNKIQFKTV